MYICIYVYKYICIYVYMYICIYVYMRCTKLVLCCMFSQYSHICFRNWSNSSSEMESDIILQGFMEAGRVHGIRYTRLIGDGDSSVHTTLLQDVQCGGMQYESLSV